MSGIRTTFHVFNTGKCSPYNTGETLFEGRPQPEKGGQDNINGTVKFYKGDICEVIAAGGGSNSANGGWSGFDGGSGAAFKGKIKILKTVEVAVQVGAKTNKNTYPLKKNTFGRRFYYCRRRNRGNRLQLRTICRRRFNH